MALRNLSQPDKKAAMVPSYTGLPGEIPAGRGCLVAVAGSCHIPHTKSRAAPLQIISSAQFWLENHIYSWGMP